MSVLDAIDCFFENNFPENCLSIRLKKHISWFHVHGSMFLVKHVTQWKVNHDNVSPQTEKIEVPLHLLFRNTALCSILCWMSCSFGWGAWTKMGLDKIGYTLHFFDVSRFLIGALGAALVKIKITKQSG